MAASATVSQLLPPRNLLAPRHGVVALYGYGITVLVDRGHLVLKDGIGGERRETQRLGAIELTSFLERDIPSARNLDPNWA